MKESVRKCARNNKLKQTHMASSDQSAYASLVSRIHHHLATVLSHSRQINEVVPRSPALSNSSASSFADQQQQQQQQSTSNSIHPSSLQPPSLASASLPIFLSNLVHQSHAYAVSLASALEGIQGIDLTLRVSSTAANLVAALMVSLAAIEDEEDGVWRELSLLLFSFFQNCPSWC
ncbi:hypothetical protein BCR33DRAFT_461131 [Rhizoclosmatium globosum]|uniref:Uncharacterized protein n=1 Tax=Rhizoclosmatium globosum TaxID=329046 RepID=A0A1Y2CX92_9FUNG|nr:hypothetical protein BCR33DRAFT_461131 [Rhizoclosmatium globosum]|eukprot:ORY51651.1 hypothetical protein BCR33DRAFT_461131 [Rhizoclosmatium globosum]